MTFDTKMKSAYVICAILGILCTLVLAQNDAVQTTPIQVPKPSIPQSSAESSKNIADSTTAVPSKTTHESTTLSTTIITTTANATTTTTKSTTATPNNTTITSTITIPTTTPTTPTPTSTSAPTSPKPTPTSPVPEPTTATTDAAKTTSVPPSSKDRQFDGLSFFGGIVLTTCLMAIAAFSWRFYRQCKEGNYRTL